LGSARIVLTETSLHREVGSYQHLAAQKCQETVSITAGCTVSDLGSDSCAQLATYAAVAAAMSCVIHPLAAHWTWGPGSWLRRDLPCTLRAVALCMLWVSEMSAACCAGLHPAQRSGTARLEGLRQLDSGRTSLLSKSLQLMEEAEWLACSHVALMLSMSLLGGSS
jgi:hypothetical protein